MVTTIPFGRKWGNDNRQRKQNRKNEALTRQRRGAKKRPLSLYLFSCGREVPFGRSSLLFPARAVVVVMAVCVSRGQGGQTEW